MHSFEKDKCDNNIIVKIICRSIVSLKSIFFINYKMSRLADRIAEEAQLLAEEKWLISTLTKLKSQRNALQIERLQLEHLEANLKMKLNSEGSGNQNYGQAPKVDSLTQNGVQEPSSSKLSNPTALGSIRDKTQFEKPLEEELVQNMDLDVCNDEELDLSVSTSVFNNEFKKNILEEDEEEDDDNMFIDMNMFMNSKNSLD